MWRPEPGSIQGSRAFDGRGASRRVLLRNPSCGRVPLRSPRPGSATWSSTRHACLGWGVPVEGRRPPAAEDTEVLVCPACRRAVGHGGTHRVHHFEHLDGFCGRDRHRSIGADRVDECVELVHEGIPLGHGNRFSAQGAPPPVHTRDRLCEQIDTPVLAISHGADDAKRWGHARGGQIRDAALELESGSCPGARQHADP